MNPTRLALALALAAALPARAAEPEPPAAARATGHAAFDAFLARLSGGDAGDEAASADPLGTTAPTAPSPAPIAPPALRYERVLAPQLALRAAPDPRAEATGALPPGARIAVDRIQRGWKQVRGADGAAGWIEADAATPDVFAPERMSELLAPLHAVLAPGASTSEALCSSLPRERLSDLVALWRVEQRGVYLRPLWHALPAEDQRAFRAWARDCYDVTRLYDAASGGEIESERLQPTSLAS